MEKKLKIFIVEKNRDELNHLLASLEKEEFIHLFVCRDWEQFFSMYPYSNTDVVIAGSLPAQASSKLRKLKSSGHFKIALSCHERETTNQHADMADISFVRNDLSGLLTFLGQTEAGLPETDERIFKRFKKHKALAIDPESDGVDFIQDVSLGGIGFESRFSFDSGAKLMVHAKLKGEEKYKPVKGTIVWKAFGERGLKYGLEFDKPIVPNDEK
ncbi:MAG: hypothetical protein A2268_10290 [Candidatus Raymondbacteria bacterium RifOxyA12_full_50_37]|uniref:PilZ domain-containing protein n=1 Tax=Candidatus Raymondbacteria bacterium RIFOXYD12_FULL_49_13 TaxID=1817890 RepID=A0A1F7FK96_UNCRA|nr:MAG: hypothetical protein A2268_10290 [Candidatus Raymondbacteria bacterium RifOxyA12_full_50_37]OGJ90152.1 MAG: hypothetical protein A2248_16770 [Candidatus Raymondbacteria bacterium RIFOXYA2_FULL_49_16]OGJ97223.1 MAG: hypothetical protein A2453_01260 [Candidatus Raymondbacteria bacterium RIFOXYC2_FULL_50_21]OGK04491.1 MAG: hypothetical protein A2350_15300 [Candidatus Raymondbacteria bacterium RifOxyB12_full_50_8]OGK07144.1 MAG: hypothetical protein A2519_09330 [Candidatus Raymondbacteria b